MTGREPGNTYARMTFLRLTKEGSEHAKETVTNCYSFKIQGSRGPNHRISEYLNLLNPTEEEAEEDYRITPKDWVLLRLLSIYGSISGGYARRRFHTSNHRISESLNL